MTDPEKTQFYDEALATSVQDTFSELFREKNEDDAEKGDKDEDAEASLFAAEAET